MTTYYKIQDLESRITLMEFKSNRVKHTDIYPDLYHYVSQDSLKSCMKEYLYFLGQGVFKKLYKNHLKGKLYSVYRDLTKTSFRPSTSKKKSLFRHATSC